MQAPARAATLDPGEGSSDRPRKAFVFHLHEILRGVGNRTPRASCFCDWTAGRPVQQLQDEARCRGSGWVWRCRWQDAEEFAKYCELPFVAGLYESMKEATGMATGQVMVSRQAPGM